MKWFKILMVVTMCGCIGTLGWGAEVKIAHDTPPDPEKSGTYVWARTFASHLEAKGVKTKEFPRDALGGEEEKLDQVSQGLLEVSMSDLAKAGQLEQMIFGFNLPYLFDSIAHLDRMTSKTNLMAKVNSGTARKGVLVLALLPVGGLSGLSNTKRVVKTPDDLKGMRIRAMDSAQAQYIQAWGASTVVIPWAEIYNALQTGIADGYLNPAIVPVLFKHTEVLKYYSDLRFNASLRVAICSNQWYQGLTKEIRSVVEEGVAKATAANRDWQLRIEKSGLDALMATGVKVHVSTPEERAQFAKLLRPIYTKVVSEETARAFIAAADSTR